MPRHGHAWRAPAHAPVQGRDFLAFLHTNTSFVFFSASPRPDERPHGRTVASRHEKPFQAFSVQRRKTLALASGFIAPTPSLCSLSVHPVCSPDLAFSESIAPVSTISLSSVQPVIVNCLCSDLFDLVSSGSLIFSSLGPINLIVIILTHILVQVLCVSSIAKTLY